MNRPVPPSSDASLLAAIARATEIAKEAEIAHANGKMLDWTTFYAKLFDALNQQIEKTPPTTIEGARAKVAYTLLDGWARPYRAPVAHAALAELLALGGKA